MKTISIVIQTMKGIHLTGQRMGFIVGLAGHAGVAEIAGRHPGDRTAGIAERCGLRHDLRRKDRIIRFVSAHVLLERGVMMGLAMFFAGFVFMLGLLMAGSGCADLVVVSHGVNKGKGSAVRTSLGYAAEHGFDALVLLDGDGQHDPGEIPGLLEPLSNDAADIVIGFRSFGQMPVYRRFGRAVLDQ